MQWNPNSIRWQNSLTQERWFLERQYPVSAVDFRDESEAQCQVLQKGDPGSQLSLYQIWIHLDQDRTARYLIPLRHKDADIEFSSPALLQWALEQCGIPHKLERWNKLEGSTNPVFEADQRYLIKFHPHIHGQDNREVTILEKLSGICDQVPELYGYVKVPEEHVFCMVTPFEKNAESGWQGFSKLIQERSWDTACTNLNIIGEQLKLFHERMKEVFGQDCSKDSRKQCYYDSLAAALQMLDNNKVEFNVQALPALQVIHGDFHLGQILTDKDQPGTFKKIIDLEGPPLESPASRRRLKSPLHDVAGMLRSLDYAVLLHGPKEEKASQKLRNKLESAFKNGYFSGQNDAVEKETLSLMYCLQRAIYEESYEQASRPDWVWIPREGQKRLLQLLQERGIETPEQIDGEN